MGSSARTRTCSRTGSRPPAACRASTRTGCGTPGSRKRAGTASGPAPTAPPPRTREPGCGPPSRRWRVPPDASCWTWLSSGASPLHLEDRQERLLRDLDRADLLHPALALLLLFEPLALARDGATV